MDHFEDESDPFNRPRQLPPDLPTSLDDRRKAPVFGGETEIYDAWQGVYFSNISAGTNCVLRSALASPRLEESHD